MIERVDYTTLSILFKKQMQCKKDTVRSLAKLLKISPATVGRMRSGLNLSAEQYLMSCLYSDTSPTQCVIYRKV